MITRCSSGFGEGAVKAFADNGCLAWGTSRHVNGGNATKRRRLKRIRAMYRSATTTLTRTGTTEAFSIAQAKEQMKTNYYGAIGTTQAVLPAMRASKSGLIINTSSLVEQISQPFFSTYSATRRASEGDVQGLYYEASPFGIDVVLVQPGPFGMGLLSGGTEPERTDVVAGYGDSAALPNAMGQHSATLLQSEETPKPQSVVDAYQTLADRPVGKRLTRSVVGIIWGADEINAVNQPIQDRVSKEMQLGGVSRGADILLGAWPAERTLPPEFLQRRHHAYHPDKRLVADL